jgi:hypothetical protein
LGRGGSHQLGEIGDPPPGFAKAIFVGVQHAGVCLEQGLGSDGDLLLFFFGDDQNERPLEIAGAEGPTGRLTVIHSMQLRERFEDQYMEALRWRK